MLVIVLEIIISSNHKQTYLSLHSKVGYTMNPKNDCQIVWLIVSKVVGRSTFIQSSVCLCACPCACDVFHFKWKMYTSSLWSIDWRKLTLALKD